MISGKSSYTLFSRVARERHILADNRFIHSHPWWPRLVEELTVEEGLLKQPLLITLGGNWAIGKRNMSLY